MSLEEESIEFNSSSELKVEAMLSRAGCEDRSNQSDSLEEDGPWKVLSMDRFGLINLERFLSVQRRQQTVRRGEDTGSNQH